MAKIPYTLIHEHRHGIDIFNFVSEKEFSSEFRYDDEAIKNKSLLKKLGVEFEYDRDEKFHIVKTMVDIIDVDKKFDSEEKCIDQLLPLINEYKSGSDEPLDGDEVDSLCEIIKAMINLHEGNITEEEYNEILG